MLQRAPTVADRVRQRIKEELVRLGWSQRDLADRLHASTGDRWSQPGIAKVIRGRVHLRINDVATIAEVLGVPFLEMVRDRGLEFVAEMTPTEVRVFERLRRLSADETHAVLTILGLSSSEQTRYARGHGSSRPLPKRPPTFRESVRKLEADIDQSIATREQDSAPRTGTTGSPPRPRTPRQPPTPKRRKP